MAAGERRDERHRVYPRGRQEFFCFGHDFSVFDDDALPKTKVWRDGRVEEVGVAAVSARRQMVRTSAVSVIPPAFGRMLNGGLAVDDDICC